MPESSMRVAVRTRPLSAGEKARGEHIVVQAFCSERVVRITRQGRAGAVLSSERGAQHQYQFDKTFGPGAQQQEVYEGTTRALVAETLKGRNCTVFAYGATGAGKTHTMLGTDEDPGIIPRALVDMFRGIARIEESFASDPNAGRNETREWRIKVSYLEVYNETIFDLLTDKQRPLQPCEDPNDSRVKVLGLTELRVTEVAQVLDLLRAGNARRRMESTAANEVSSRSHAVIQVNVECEQVEVLQPEATASMERRRRPKRAVTTSTLALIDLAGSERAASTQNRGARLREGANINRSLLALANCINALSQKKPSRVKYRDSKLTHLLKSSLEGNCHLSMIAAINPSHKCYEESHNTLKYANRAKDIKIRNSPQQNRRQVTDSKETHRIDELEAENQELRERLSVVSRQSAASEDPLNSVVSGVRAIAPLTAPAEPPLPPPPPRAAPSTPPRGQQPQVSTPSGAEADKRLQSRVQALELQNRTLASLASSKLRVTPRKLDQAVETAARRAQAEYDAKLRDLEALVREQQKQIERLARAAASGPPPPVPERSSALEEDSRGSSNNMITNLINKSSSSSSNNNSDARRSSRRQSFIPKPAKKRQSAGVGTPGEPARLKQKVAHANPPSPSSPGQSSLPPPPGTPSDSSLPGARSLFKYTRLRMRSAAKSR